MLNTIDTVIASAAPCSSALPYPASGVLVEQWDGYSYQVNFDYSGASSGSASGTIFVQISDDATKFINRNATENPVVSAAYTSGSTAIILEVPVHVHKYSRLNFSPVSGTGGKMDILFHGVTQKK
jgi:hypothetical protein